MRPVVTGTARMAHFVADAAPHIQLASRGYPNGSSNGCAAEAEYSATCAATLLKLVRSRVALSWR